MESPAACVAGAAAAASSLAALEAAVLFDLRNILRTRPKGESNFKPQDPGEPNEPLGRVPLPSFVSFFFSEYLFPPLPPRQCIHPPFLKYVLPPPFFCCHSADTAYPFFSS